ncbi:hypothetical protein DB30_04005 [Enhygromyxa salina]|uniref:Uncharacterized protein n=1 Tax=Enhygromyxa salina TaxID=215803 RepID=A0A0C2A0E8_9BACT|nr:hypothetical protein [Enhygromyxa salina]KIG16843.1 hypothetical protein DB30_04005 [Enhygromyxa salina]
MSELDPESELRRLLRFMTRPGPRFGLALARYGDLRIAEAVRERLIVEAASSGCYIATVELSRADQQVDLVSKFAAAIGGGDQRLDGLFVAGLERVLLDARGELSRAPSLSNLNQRRDRLPELLDARVVLWVAEPAYAAYAELLRDLSEVMLTSAKFPSRPTLVEQGRIGDWPGWMTRVEPGAESAVLEQAHRLAALHGRTSELLARGELAASVAGLFASLGEQEQTQAWLERASNELERAGEPARAAAQATRLAIALEHWGDDEGALAMASRAVGLARRAGSLKGEVEALGVEAAISKRRQ